jgi:hypothetical protein
LLDPAGTLDASGHPSTADAWRASKTDRTVSGGVNGQYDFTFNGHFHQRDQSGNTSAGSLTLLDNTTVDTIGQKFNYTYSSHLVLTQDAQGNTTTKRLTPQAMGRCSIIERSLAYGSVS